MKSTIKQFWILLLAAGGLLSACKKDFLNTKPLDQIDGAATWQDPALAQAFVFGLYGGLFEGGFDEEMLAALTDEAIFTHQGRNINTINQGSASPSNPGWQNRTTSFGEMYRFIRQTNIALQNLPDAAIADEMMKKRLIGEARFLRAYYYHQLLRFYGGVPLVTKPYLLSDSFSIARNTYAEIHNFIITEADQAITLLAGQSKVKGRPSDLAAMALKARQLLYAASDLHDVPTAKSKSTVLNSYANPELVGFVSGDRRARWQAAKDAAKAVLDAAGSGYKTNLTAPVTADEGRKNYLAIAMGGRSKHPDADAAVASSNEILFERTFSPEQEVGAMRHGLRQGPNGYNNWAGNTPIQQVVDDYELMDGTRFDWTNPAHKADPYANRDPRFYASILYDGAGWKPRNRAEDPANQIQTGTYFAGANKIVGIDTRQGPIENWNGSFTGYYFRKFIDPDPAIRDNTTPQLVPWPFFRYTEAVLNYVEACIELGEDAEARNWLNKIRFRAGMPAATESGAALRDRYRNERRVELLLEEQRYFDARRWMIAPQTLGRKVQFIQIEGQLKPGATAPSPYRKDPNVFNYTYTPVVNNDLENRTWLDKMYFRPISLSEIQRNSKLVQNPGYE
ncbi:RagB/SusD family nutrient uptake outer membrane protein [Cnuella takakiae]|uniref:RagB/SusD family nutrient uptake outer membrane protein n=1 Tax=Cnuella takakiae TaxID=1302690 RepID=UPI0009350D90|nr:RagB/SusD family nutrient uptake outer membrane protein [Cnuella takakiae]OLY92404.1 RagB/SusD family nutrient uptake outer membrane protein [Cnuella takakiae]